MYLGESKDTQPSLPVSIKICGVRALCHSFTPNLCGLLFIQLQTRGLFIDSLSEPWAQHQKRKVIVSPKVEVPWHLKLGTQNWLNTPPPNPNLLILKNRNIHEESSFQQDFIRHQNNMSFRILVLREHIDTEEQIDLCWLRSRGGGNRKASSCSSEGWLFLSTVYFSRRLLINIQCKTTPKYLQIFKNIFVPISSSCLHFSSPFTQREREARGGNWHLSESVPTSKPLSIQEAYKTSLCCNCDIYMFYVFLIGL